MSKKKLANCLNACYDHAYKLLGEFLSAMFAKNQKIKTNLDKAKTILENIKTTIKKVHKILNKERKIKDLPKTPQGLNRFDPTYFTDEPDVTLNLDEISNKLATWALDHKNKKLIKKAFGNKVFTKVKEKLKNRN